MSVQEVLARIAQIDTAFNPRPPAQAADPTSFRAVLGAQTDAAAPTTLGALATGQVGYTPAVAPGADGTGPAAMVRAAAAEIGQSEQPPGSNDSPRIAQYRWRPRARPWGRGARTSPRGPRARRAFRSASRARASARSA